MSVLSCAEERALLSLPPQIRRMIIHRWRGSFTRQRLRAQDSRPHTGALRTRNHFARSLRLVSA